MGERAVYVLATLIAILIYIALIVVNLLFILLSYLIHLYILKPIFLYLIGTYPFDDFQGTLLVFLIFIAWDIRIAIKSKKRNYNDY